MPIMGDIKNLYSDKNQSRALFPTTKIKAVSDDDGKGLNAVLDDMTAHTRKVGNPYNLLDNSDFRNPVNQRGQTSYANTTYTIDRWKWSYAATTRTVTINDKSISISNQSAATGYFEQLFEKALKEGAYTIAVKVDGAVYSRVITAFDQNQALQLNGTTSVYLATGGAALTFMVNSGGTLNNIEWAALYEGEYTAETLPEYQPKGYGVELAECMRYFQGIDFTWKALTVATRRTSTSFRAVINMPVLMRTNNPTGTISNLNKTEGTVLVIDGGNLVISDISFNNGRNVAFLTITLANSTTATAGIIYGGGNDCYVQLSADL